jgi:hypothetical protein
MAAVLPILLLALSAIFAAPATATTYQVGPGKPHANLQSVAPLLGPGDLVLVDGGTTYPGGVVLDRAGTASQPIVVRGLRAGGARPRISGATNTLEVRANHYVLEGLELTGGSFRCLYHHAHDVVARDLSVHGCAAHGLLGADDDSGSLLLEYSEFYDCGAGTTQHCIYMATDEVTYPGAVFRMQHNYVHDTNGGNAIKSRAQRNEIYFNWIEGGLYHELELIGPDPAGGNAVSGVREDSDVVGNVLRKTNTFSVTRFGGDGTGASAGRYRFAFNTVITQAGGGAVFRLFDPLESVEMHGNVFYGAGGAAVNLLREVEAEWVSGRVVGGDRNWVTSGSQNVPPEWTGTITGTNPGFADFTTLDLRPAAGAPIRDAGPAATSSPPGHPFPAPLFPPALMPPLHTTAAPGTALARSPDGPLDAGAYEHAGGTVGYPRPLGATPVRVSLTPAYRQCTGPNRQHGAPLASGSCGPPQPASSRLTVGSEPNGLPAGARGSVRYGVLAGDPGTTANEADVSVRTTLTDVRRQGTLADYTGELAVEQPMQITDRFNGPSQAEPATVQPGVMRFAVPCVATASPVGGTCSLQSSFNAIVPGSVVEGKRAVWELQGVAVFDGGADGQAATTGDNTLFQRQGVFVP